MRVAAVLAAAPAVLAGGCGVCGEAREEYCSVFPKASLCDKPCGFVFDAVTNRCWEEGTVPALSAPADAPIIGGQGKYRYQYMPDLLQAPAGAAYANCHGLSVDKDENIIMTYQHAGNDSHCIIRWNPDGTGGEFAGDTPELCGGTPHGLKITTEEGGQQFLYHANNAQKLVKTDLTGKTVWMREGPFGQDMTCGPSMCPNKSCSCPGGQAPYKPTWFATPPDSPYMYLCDGYGSDRVFAFERATGRYMNRSWAGRSPAGLHPGEEGPTQPHGLFMENHGCTYDPRPTTKNNTIVVSDRRNQRFEFFNYDPATPDTFSYYKTVDLGASMGRDTLPCNMRMTHGSRFDPSKGGVSVVPDLNGPVAVLSAEHEVLSVVNVSVLLAKQQHKHPHDAIFLANGDIVVVTWAPGRVSYWKLLPAQD